ncbi:hypothetical protein FRC14_005399, partial [Serendipita sp. 396]
MACVNLLVFDPFLVVDLSLKESSGALTTLQFLCYLFGQFFSRGFCFALLGLAARGSRLLNLQLQHLALSAQRQDSYINEAGARARCGRFIVIFTSSTTDPPPPLLGKNDDAIDAITAPDFIDSIDFNGYIDYRSTAVEQWRDNGHGRYRSVNN